MPYQWMKERIVMIKIKWVNGAWRIQGKGVSFLAINYKEAFFFVKYAADLDVAFMLDYLLND
jgi:hypothetical protein